MTDWFRHQSRVPDTDVPKSVVAETQDKGDIVVDTDL